MRDDEYVTGHIANQGRFSTRLSVWKVVLSGCGANCLPNQLRKRCDSPPPILTERHLTLGRATPDPGTSKCHSQGRDPRRPSNIQAIYNIPYHIQVKRNIIRPSEERNLRNHGAVLFFRVKVFTYKAIK